MNYITIIGVDKRNHNSENENNTFIHVDYYLVRYGTCVNNLQPNVERIQESIILRWIYV